jgi:hypothetical protein
LLTYTAIPSLSICQGSSLTLTGNAAVSYTWYGGITNGSPFVPLAGSSYTFSGTGSNGCVGSIILTPLLNSQPSIILQPGNQTVSAGSSCQFVTAASSNNSVFQWQFLAGQVFSNISDGSQFSGSGTATLTLFSALTVQNGYKFRCVISEGNCSDTSAIAMLTVLNDTGIWERALQKQIKISPNPAKETFSIYRTNYDKNEAFIVYDETGKLVLHGELIGAHTVVELSALESGLYFVRIVGSVQAPVKIVKE